MKLEAFIIAYVHFGKDLMRSHHLLIINKLFCFVYILAFANQNFAETDNTLKPDADVSSLDIEPYFDVDINRNVTAVVGSSAYLKCKVLNLGNRTVNWIFVEHLLWFHFLNLHKYKS